MLSVFRVHEAVPGEEMEVVEVEEVVEVMIIITSNLEPNNPSDGAAAPPELGSDPQQTHTAPSERERGAGAHAQWRQRFLGPPHCECGAGRLRVAQ